MAISKKELMEILGKVKNLPPEALQDAKLMAKGLGISAPAESLTLPPELAESAKKLQDWAKQNGGKIDIDGEEVKVRGGHGGGGGDGAATRAAISAYRVEGPDGTVYSVNAGGLSAFMRKNGLMEKHRIEFEKEWGAGTKKGAPDKLRALGFKVSTI